MEGIPGLSSKNHKKVDDSAEIHARAREIFLAVCHKGGIGVFEQPPTAMSWLLDGMRHMSQEVEAHIAWVDACNHGMMLSKSWAFLSNSPEIQHIGCLCQHAERHESIAGKRNAEGVFISTLTAEYPSSLAQHIIRHMSYLVTRSGLGEIALPKLDESWSRPFQEPRHRPCDGAGLWSTADHTSPKQATQLRAVAEAWLAWAHQTDMPARVAAHINQSKPDPPLTPGEADEAALIAFKALETAPPPSLLPEKGQNFRLRLVEAFAQGFRDQNRPAEALFPLTPVDSGLQWPRQSLTRSWTWSYARGIGNTPKNIRRSYRV